MSLGKLSNSKIFVVAILDAMGWEVDVPKMPQIDVRGPRASQFVPGFSQCKMQTVHNNSQRTVSVTLETTQQ